MLRIDHTIHYSELRWKRASMMVSLYWIPYMGENTLINIIYTYKYKKQKINIMCYSGRGRYRDGIPCTAMEEAVWKVIFGMIEVTIYIYRLIMVFFWFYHKVFLQRAVPPFIPPQFFCYIISCTAFPKRRKNFVLFHSYSLLNLRQLP